MSGHTPGLWTAHDDDGTGTLPCILSDKVNRGGNFYVAQCNNFEDARFIVQACNLHEELVAALTEIVAESGHARPADWMRERAKTALAKAEGREDKP